MKINIPVLGLIALFCFGCSRVSEQGVRQFSSNPAPVAANQPTPKIVPEENTATVISLHANLRAEDNSKSAVLEVVPQEASVEVIKQQGAWFLVKTETNQGWLHGNTIKLQSYGIQPQKKQKSALSIRPSQPIERTSESENDISSDDYKSSASREYITGPRGGCYYINSNGNKTYVDRSMCDSSEPSYSKPSISNNGYIRGPRGGCYYITGNGRKQYVDRSLCN